VPTTAAAHPHREGLQPGPLSTEAWGSATARWFLSKYEVPPIGLGRSNWALSRQCWHEAPRTLSERCPGRRTAALPPSLNSPLFGHGSGVLRAPPRPSTELCTARAAAEAAVRAVRCAAREQTARRAGVLRRLCARPASGAPVYRRITAGVERYRGTRRRLQDASRRRSAELTSDRPAGSSVAGRWHHRRSRPIARIPSASG
jgi:hypothetical protein